MVIVMCVRFKEGVRSEKDESLSRSLGHILTFTSGAHSGLRRGRATESAQKCRATDEKGPRCLPFCVPGGEGR